MLKTDLLQNLEKVVALSKMSKLSRFVVNPYKYYNSVIYRKLFYAKSKKNKELVTSTFFNEDMTVLIPASTDIYLTGGKSHDSEVRLAKFLINRLDEGDTFIDVGGHYGYFSLLASKLVGQNGKVECFEAAPNTYSILKKNAELRPNIYSHHVAISDGNETLKFYEFPNLYSEYNTMDVTQFENEPWYKDNKPVKVEIPSIKLDNFLTEESILKPLIKIDVEGAEFKVINGMKDYLAKNKVVVVMEYLSTERGNDSHNDAHKVLISAGYQSHTIDSDGNSIACIDVQGHIYKHKLESDNIAYIKQMS